MMAPIGYVLVGMLVGLMLAIALVWSDRSGR